MDKKPGSWSKRKQQRKLKKKTMIIGFEECKNYIQRLKESIGYVNDTENIIILWFSWWEQRLYFCECRGTNMLLKKHEIKKYKNCTIIMKNICLLH